MADARFPIITARQELGVTPTTAVRFTGDVRTGEGAVGAAIGQAILSLGSRWYIMEADTQLSEAKTKAEEEHIRLMLELPGLEPSEHDKAYEESIKTRQGFIPKNRMAASAYNRLLDSSSPQWGLDVTNATKAKLKDNSRAEGFVLQQKAMRTGSFTEYFTHLVKGKMLGVYDAEEVVKYRQATIDSHKRYIETQEAMVKREQAENFKLLQDATGRQMLADLWDGKLKDPQDITDAVRSGLLSDTDGKYLRNALMSAEPPVLNLQSLAIVKQAIEEIGTNTKTVPQALSVLYANLDSIDPTTGKSLVNEIYSEQDKNKSEMKRESRSLMEELVRDRDKFTGMFTDDERQILAAAEAYLMLDTEIEKAVKVGKPLERRDIMIKAIQIGRQMKAKIKQEEAKAIPPEFSPTIEGHRVAPRAIGIKGALAKPDFSLDEKGEPEKVFDSKGTEIGIRRKAGGVFKIGYHVMIGGKKYEYIGNGNWIEVK